MNDETPLQMAQRHVDEGKARVAQQAAFVDELSRRDEQGPVAEQAAELLAVLNRALDLAYEGLARERQRAGLPDTT